MGKQAVRSVEELMLEGIETSQAEQDKDPEQRMRKKPRKDLDSPVVEEEYTWTYTDEWWLVDALAEYLDNQGRPESAAYVWMATEKKRPYKAGDEGWVWFCDRKIAEGLGDPHSDIPQEVYDKMLTFELEEAFQKMYKTHKVALGECARAFLEAVQGGWVPPQEE